MLFSYFASLRSVVVVGKTRATFSANEKQNRNQSSAWSSAFSRAWRWSRVFVPNSDWFTQARLQLTFMFLSTLDRVSHSEIRQFFVLLGQSLCPCAFPCRHCCLSVAYCEENGKSNILHLFSSHCKLNTLQLIPMPAACNTVASILSKKAAIRGFSIVTPLLKGVGC